MTEACGCWWEWAADRCWGGGGREERREDRPGHDCRVGDVERYHGFLDGDVEYDLRCLGWRFV